MCFLLFFPAFKKQFMLNISIKWQSTVKPSPDEPQNPSKGHLPPTLNSQFRPPFIPPGFCRAVGGPTASQHPPSCSTTSSPSQGHVVSAVSSASPMMLLHKMFEAAGFGQPRYDIYCSHAGPDGFLYFTYKVCIPGLSSAFEGVVMILPGPTPSTTMEEAQRAAAQQILLRVYHNQLAH